MGAPTSMSDIVNRLSDGKGQVLPFRVGQGTFMSDGPMNSGWSREGTPGFGVVPTTVEACDSATLAGGLPFKPPTSGRLYIVRAGASNGAVFGEHAGVLRMHDRLLHIGGLNGTVTTPQTVGGTLTRNTDGVGNRINIDIYSMVGTTQTTLTCSYTNQDGTAGRTSGKVSIGGAVNSGHNYTNISMDVPLAAGDTGVRSVESVTLAATTGGAGNFGVSIIHPLITWGSVHGGSMVSPTQGLKEIPSIEEGAMITTQFTMNNTSGRTFFGALTVVEA